MAGRWRAEVAAATSTPPLAAGSLPMVGGWLAEVVAAAAAAPSPPPNPARGEAASSPPLDPTPGELVGRWRAPAWQRQQRHNLVAAAAAPSPCGDDSKRGGRRWRGRCGGRRHVLPFETPVAFLGELVLDEYTSLLLSLSRIREAVTKGSRDGLEGGTAVECGW
uniref:Uncharacterized protein n=1 Tax=Oryza nivara TaxID=4536 RepID=A0A0E0HC90_ORYNI